MTKRLLDLENKIGTAVLSYLPEYSGLVGIITSLIYDDREIVGLRVTWRGRLDEREPYVMTYGVQELSHLYPYYAISSPSLPPTITPTTPAPSPTIRTFDTGATRDIDTTKNDYEGFLSPLVIERFGQYMSKHRKQADGSLRDSDNWQKGIPLSAYMKSMWRHFLQLWKLYRGYPLHPMGWSKWPDGSDREPGDIEEVLCALMFNVQGYLHEVLKTELERHREMTARIEGAANVK